MGTVFFITYVIYSFVLATSLQFSVLIDFKNSHVCVCLFLRTCVMEDIQRSEGNFVEPALVFFIWVAGIKHRLV